MTVEKYILDVCDNPTILGAMNAGRELRRAVRKEWSQDRMAQLFVEPLRHDSDPLTRFLMIRALSEVTSADADEYFIALLNGDDDDLRRHAAWSFAERPMLSPALPGLTRLVIGGGFGAFLAQQVLEKWSWERPREIANSLRNAFAKNSEIEARAKLVETLGLVREPATHRWLADLATNDQIPSTIRAQAVRGLPGPLVSMTLESLTKALDDPNPDLRLAAAERLGDRAEAGDRNARTRLEAWLSVADNDLAAAAARNALNAPQIHNRRPSNGFRIAQIVLQGRVDANLADVGSGDSGGLATLLVSLGRALGAHTDIHHAFTIARAFEGDGVPSKYQNLSETMGDGASLARIPFGGSGDLNAGDMWAHRVTIERGLKRLFRRLGHLNAVHLRFADAGTWSAARVAQRLGIPTFFSLAPDPHNVIRAGEEEGALSRENFADVERRQHFLFRAELAEQMIRQSRSLAVFPRPDLAQDLKDLMGVDVNAHPRRFVMVPEGIDTRVPEKALQEIRHSLRRPTVIEELTQKIAALPHERQGLPLLVSVGRLHPVKGMHRLVRAWAEDKQLRRQFNLLIVGGNLQNPNATEAEVLASVEQTLRKYPQARNGLLLFGQRSNLDAARLLATVRWGAAPMVAAGGVYVCASDKEEFGLALLEAMAAGLAVVGPNAGGPATYIEDGENGFLTRTVSIPQLRIAIHRAADERLNNVRTENAQRLIREHFPVEAMAAGLAEMYDASNAARVASISNAA